MQHLQSTIREHAQCDLHRRQDEARRGVIADRAARQGKRNRAEWLRRSYVAARAGDFTLARNLFDRAEAEQVSC